MTDNEHNDDQKKSKGAEEEAKEQDTQEEERLPSSVDSILQARLKLEEERAALDQMLKDKCRREQMTSWAVLLEWGDPREWSDS